MSQQSKEGESLLSQISRTASKPDGMGLIHLVDGITLQHVAELLFANTKTENIRHSCARTYEHCLESFCYAVLYGERISHAGTLPDVAGLPAAASLAKKLGRIFEDIPLSKGYSETEFSAQNRNQWLAERQIERLAEVYRTSDWLYWKHWIVREAGAYLTETDSLCATCKPEGRVIFPDAPPYLHVPSLQRRILPSLINSLRDAIRLSYPQLSRVQDWALREFSEQNVVTHLLRDQWMDQFRCETDVSDLTRYRLPHATRASLPPLSIIEENKDVLLGLVTDFGRDALTRVLQAGPRDRSEFLKYLLEIRVVDRDACTIRKILGSLWKINDSATQKREVERIIRRTEKFASEKTGASGQVESKVGFGTLYGSVSLGGIGANALTRFLPRMRVLRGIAQRRHLRSASETTLYRIFPELKH